MIMTAGVYRAKRKSGEVYYRASITYKNRHISLGSFSLEEQAGKAYCEAQEILCAGRYALEDGCSALTLSFEKFIVLVNFRDSGVYIKNPIYLKERFFLYYLAENDVLKFDVDDLFYYSEHKIMRRGGHLFVADFGMQVSLPSRYGIKNYAVEGRDYRFVNGDNTDYRYGNIEIFSHYHGVVPKKINGGVLYETCIHLDGDWIIGRYAAETEAAVAYNKAAKYYWNYGGEKNFPVNYIEELDKKQYQELFQRVTVSKKFREMAKNVKKRKK